MTGSAVDMTGQQPRASRLIRESTGLSLIGEQ
jgi:hypothetical protein